MSVLEAQNICKNYGSGDAQVAALRGISLSIEPGEFVSIMGPSGSGKSTLLTILGGVEDPSAGSVLLEGVNFTELSEDERTILRRRRLGFIFQSFNLLPNLTAEENVGLPLELDGMANKEVQQRISEALDMVEMLHRKSHLPATLSGGEQQRVAIARALAIHPALLLADEPTGNLDSRQSARVSHLLQQLSEGQGQTIVMVTHDAQVAKAANRLVLLRDGQIEQDGIPSEVLFASALTAARGV